MKLTMEEAKALLTGIELLKAVAPKDQSKMLDELGTKILLYKPNRYE